MSVRSKLARMGCVLAMVVVAGCSGGVTAPEEEAIKPMFEEQSEPPPDECFPGMGCNSYEMWEMTDEDGNAWSISCELWQPGCLLRTPTTQELNHILSIIQRLPTWARNWYLGKIADGEIFMWDTLILIGGKKLVGDVHRPWGYHGSDIDVHFWTGRVINGTLGQAINTFCHESVHAVMDMMEHTPAFEAAVLDCIAHST